MLNHQGSVYTNYLDEAKDVCREHPDRNYVGICLNGECD